jgi:hypothetical protein
MDIKTLKNYFNISNEKSINGIDNINNNIAKDKNNLNKINKDILTIFKLPIFYNNQNKLLNYNIITDLELIKINNSNNQQTTNDTNLDFGEEIQTANQEPIYNYIFKPTGCFGKNILNILPNYYTTDISFLKETQIIIQNIKNKETSIIDEKSLKEDGERSMDATLSILTKCRSYGGKKEEEEEEEEDILNILNEIKNDNGFLQKYLYIDYEHLQFLNDNDLFLQIMSLFNIASPLLSLMLPIFLLIIPFIIIKAKGININFKTYKIILYQIISEHSLGKLFTQFNNVEMDKKIYLLCSGVIYLFSIYNNFLICSKFYSNMKKIHNYLSKLKNYIKTTIKKYNNFLNITENMKSYVIFNTILKTNLNGIEEFYKELNKIIFPLTFSFTKMVQIGFILKIFYKLHNETNLYNLIIYSFGFNGFVDILNGLHDNIYIENQINYTSFSTKKNKKSYFKNMFYPTLIKNKNKIKNTYSFDKNIILSGVNASGKTTILKTVLINTILSQQFGIGCFDKSKFYPYDYLHCYLNIIDTSDRFSLFQSECLKCKEIIDNIIKNPNKKHLCIFDELFSGTNPDEAVNCGYAFLLFLSKYKYCRFLLTTHFLDLTIKFSSKTENENNIINKKMESYYLNNKLFHSYLLKNGINKIKGGYEILKEMNYPASIINTIMNNQ